MKKLMTIGAVILAACGLALAQGMVDHVNVHFSNPVLVGSKTIPAGDCSIQILRGTSENLVLAVRSQSGVVVTVLANRLDEMDMDDVGDNAEVFLTRSDNNEYRLNRIVLPDHTGFEILGSNQ
jgi:hypothetical protein